MSLSIYSECTTDSWILAGGVFHIRKDNPAYRGLSRQARAFKISNSPVQGYWDTRRSGRMRRTQRTSRGSSRRALHHRCRFQTSCSWTCSARLRQRPMQHIFSCWCRHLAIMDDIIFDIIPDIISDIIQERLWYVLWYHTDRKLITYMISYTISYNITYDIILVELWYHMILIS